MDSFMPPTTPAQIAAVYAHLHVTHRALVLTQWRVFFALLGVSLNMLIPWLLLATGLSARLRDLTARGAMCLLRLGYISRLIERLEQWDGRLKQIPRFARLAEWDGRLERWMRSLRVWREWDPAFFRTAILYAASYSFFYRLVKFPASLAAYRVEATYGLTHQSPSAWISGRGSDWLAGFAVNTLGAVLALGFIRFSPRRWPVVLAALFAGSSLIFWRLPQPPDPALARPLPGRSRRPARASAVLPPGHTADRPSGERLLARRGAPRRCLRPRPDPEPHRSG